MSPELLVVLFVTAILVTNKMGRKKTVSAPKYSGPAYKKHSSRAAFNAFNNTDANKIEDGDFEDIE